MWEYRTGQLRQPCHAGRVLLLDDARKWMKDVRIWGWWELRFGEFVDVIESQRWNYKDLSLCAHSSLGVKGQACVSATCM